MTLARPGHADSHGYSLMLTTPPFIPHHLNPSSSRVLENVKELWSEVPAGAGKKAKPISRDRIISKLFLRGMLILITISMHVNTHRLPPRLSPPPLSAFLPTLSYFIILS